MFYHSQTLSHQVNLIFQSPFHLPKGCNLYLSDCFTRNAMAFTKIIQVHLLTFLKRIIKLNTVHTANTPHTESPIDTV